MLVVLQSYSTYVSEDHVILGNAALLRCHIPSYVADTVTVDHWLVDETVVQLTPNNLNDQRWGTVITLTSKFTFITTSTIPSSSPFCTSLKHYDQLGERERETKRKPLFLIPSGCAVQCSAALSRLKMTNDVAVRFVTFLYLK